MTSADLDRILASEEPPPPSARFAAQVMAAVRTSAEPPPLPFPWPRYLAGWIAATHPARVGLRSTLAGALTALADPRLARGLAEATAGLAGTYLVLRLTARFTGAGR